MTMRRKFTTGVHPSQPIHSQKRYDRFFGVPASSVETLFLRRVGLSAPRYDA